jgi:hypothetical protein
LGAASRRAHDHQGELQRGWLADHLGKDNVIATSALAVERLEKAGAVLFGKTNVPLLLADHQSY